MLEPQGYQLMVGQTSYSYAKETSMIASLRAQRRPCCSPASSSWKRTGSRCANSAFPSWKPGPIRAIPSTCWSACPYDAGFMAASHLAERGYRRVAFMARGGAAANCRQGFAAAAAQRGLVVAELAVDNPQTIADGRAALARLLSQGGKFDAPCSAPTTCWPSAPCSKRATASWPCRAIWPCWALAKPISPARSSPADHHRRETAWTWADAPAKCCCSAWAAACRPILTK